MSEFDDIIDSIFKSYRLSKVYFGFTFLLIIFGLGITYFLHLSCRECIARSAASTKSVCRWKLAVA